MLVAVDWNETFGDAPLDRITVLFYDKVFDIIRHHVPRRRRCSAVHSKLPWWTPELRHLRNIVRKARKRYFRNKSHDNRENLKSLETRYGVCQESAFRSYTNRMESNLKRDPKSFWTYIKKLKNINRIPEEMYYNGTTVVTT